MTVAYLNRLAAMCSWDTTNSLRTKKKKKKMAKKIKIHTNFRDKKNILTLYYESLNQI